MTTPALDSNTHNSPTTVANITKTAYIGKPKSKLNVRGQLYKYKYNSWVE